MPVEPEPSQWALPQCENLDAVGELVGVGADLEPGTLLAAYRAGLFPMPLPADMQVENSDLMPIGWWSPDPRGILPLDGLKVSRSLRKSARKFEIRIDTDFDGVIEGCADPSRPHGWINEDIMRAYRELFHLGWVHSFEAWSIDDNTLAGGTYGIAIGAFFAAESMFHYKTDAGKVAIAAMVQLLGEHGFELLDVQWRMDNTARLGAVEIPRPEYLERLAGAVGRRSELLGPLQQPRRLDLVANS